MIFMLKKTKKIIEQLLNENQRLHKVITNLKANSAQSITNAGSLSTDNEVALANAWTLISQIFQDMQALIKQLQQQTSIDAQQLLLKTFINNYQHIIVNNADQELLINFAKNYHLQQSALIKPDHA